MTPILVVDGEPKGRTVLKKLLLREGFETLATHDRASAISIIREFGGNIAALVTDTETTGTCGIALAQTVTAEFPHIPILFVSAAAISQEDLRGVAPRCALVGKPYVPKDLVHSLRNLLSPGPPPYTS
jgi:CheY-like chemotaxis protein